MKVYHQADLKHFGASCVRKEPTYIQEREELFSFPDTDENKWSNGKEG
jgi:hypothetical protein